MSMETKTSPAAAPEPAPAPSDFIRDIVIAHVVEKKYPQIHTRFPPEPNGYLHIGHAKSICLNVGIARQYGGVCNLRMDDTNPTREDVEYVDSITEDLRWLIAGWADDRLGFKRAGDTPHARGRDVYLEAVRNPSPGAPLEPFFASDYFEPLYEYALELIRRGKAYVCDHTADEVDEMRGAPIETGRESEYRNRGVE